MGRRLDLTGQKFGKLTVIEPAGTVYSGAGKYAGGYPKTRWRCRCDCGNEKIVFTGDLRRGDTKSCGCICNSKDHIQKLQESHKRWLEERRRTKT